MDGNAAVGFEPAVGEATAPDYIVTAVKWKIYFESEACPPPTVYTEK